VHEAVDGGDADSVVGENPLPRAEGLVGGDRQAAVLVAPGDQLEQDGGLDLILVGTGDVVEDQEVELVEFCQRGFEREVAAGRLQPLHEIGGRQFLLLETMPDIGRPFAELPELRELSISFGDSGYVALYGHEPAEDAVYVLAFRNQKEAGY
jgi:hypothetical protein